MNSDFRDLLQSLHECEVRYLLVGGYAVIHYAQPRYTKDLDVWVEPTPENARKLMRAFSIFGIPLIGVSEQDFAVPGTQFSVGRAPCEIDFLTVVPGLNDFPAAWENKSVSEETGFPIYYVSRKHLIEAKKASGRARDLADLEELER